MMNVFSFGYVSFSGLFCNENWRFWRWALGAPGGWPRFSGGGARRVALHFGADGARVGQLARRPGCRHGPRARRQSLLARSARLLLVEGVRKERTAKGREGGLWVSTRC
eukprot:3831660-Pleurochrysis_carterae.AAC.3